MKGTILSVLAAAALAACGGGGSSGSGNGSVDNGGTTTNASGSLSGTAAGGAPLVGTVTVKDSLGATKVVTIAADGTYNIDVTGMTGPFMLRAAGTVGGTSVTYYSAATNADVNKTVNVTPFTSLIISNIAAKLAETYYNEGSFAGTITAGSLDSAISSLQQKLAPALQALGLSASVDLLRTSFTANHTGLDAALDLIKVSINPATNVATLKNALSNATIGVDRLSDRSDDTAAVTLSDAEKNALNAAQTDMQKVQAVLNQFAALFAGSGLPSITQLQNSGVFDNGSNFMMGGASFQQFASDVSTEDFLLGMKLVGSDLIFSPTNSNAVRAKVQLTFSNGVAESFEFALARADANSAWKITGDGRIADISVEPMAVYQPAGSAGAMSLTSGVQMYAEAGDYNANPSGQATPVTAAVVTGPGIDSAGVRFEARNEVAYLAIAGTTNNVIPECQGSQTAGCINIAAMTDNSEYTVKLYSGTTLLNGSGYIYNVSKKPVPSSQLSPSMFPSLTALTIDGSPVTQLSHFQAGKNLSVSWSMPAGVRADWLSVLFVKGSSGQELLESELAFLTTPTKLVSLGAAPTGATFAHVWLNGRDIYGRDYVLNYRYASN